MVTVPDEPAASAEASATSSSAAQISADDGMSQWSQNAPCTTVFASAMPASRSERRGLPFEWGPWSSPRASRARAEAVRDWLVDSGVDEARISLIAFGEQNPVAPNARPDGSPDPVGRAANRRVEIEVRSENAEPEEETPTLAETLAGSVEEESGESAESPE